MNVVFADASFLVSAFLGDDNGERAWRWWQTSRSVIRISRLVLLEAENAIRAAPFSNKCSREESSQALNGLVRARLEGMIERREVESRRLYPAAQRLSIHHTGPDVFGAMDILHVAAALESDARYFASFDASQRKLAKAAGLAVVP
jgi:predicted nucleic acid-binding protein